jgi:transcriptional antiterminator
MTYNHFISLEVKRKNIHINELSKALNVSRRAVQMKLAGKRKIYIDETLLINKLLEVANEEKRL